ncbi:MAG TPA: hypothetical protein VE398_07830, partial [Acidobacteriota bacterium]|nr:hypothetical protein [Acidobacteriota bacterium]
MMKTAGGLVLLFCTTGMPWAYSVAAGQGPEHNLVENYGFEVRDAATGLPTGWSTVTPRQEVAPSFALDSGVSHSGKSSARIK